MSLSGKSIFVTGGSRGIGAAIVRQCVEAGANVTFTYQASHSKAMQLVEELGSKVLALQMEVTDRNSVRAALNRAYEHFGSIDGLVNNAGINKPCDFDKLTDDDWDNILSVNLKGPFICSQEALEFLEKSEHPSIVHIGSVSGQFGGPRTAHYAASKAGLISLSQVIARFGAPKGVRSNTVAAGYIESEMAASGLASASVAKVAEGTILKRQGKVNEVADSVVYLLSEKSSYITAQTLNVNGGLYF